MCVCVCGLPWRDPSIVGGLSRLALCGPPQLTCLSLVLSYCT